MANDFSGDSSCKALWRFESGALTTDSIGGNTLVADGSVTPTNDTTTYIEGNSSVLFPTGASSPRPHLYIEDANLDSGFPLKSSSSATVFSVAFWVKSLLTTATRHILAKGGSGTEGIRIYTHSSTGLTVVVVSTADIINAYDIPLNDDQWYHVGLALDITNKTLLARVYDSVAETATTYNHDFDVSMGLNANPLVIGSDNGWSNYLSAGNIDEFVVFDELKTADDFDDIRAGTLGSSASTSDNMEISAPAPTIDYGYTYRSFLDGYMAFKAPSPTLVISKAGDLAISANNPRITISGYSRFNIIGIEVPAPVVSVASRYLSTNLAISVPAPSIAISVLAGTFSPLTLKAPAPEITIIRNLDSSGVLAITVPVPIIELANYGTIYSCSVLNTEIWEVTEYTGWNFNYLLKFNDQYFGVNSSGMYLLGGNTKAGSDINSVIETGLDDCGTVAAKRASYLAIGCNAEDYSEVTVQMDRVPSDNSYLMEPTDGYDASVKVPIGYPRQTKHINYIIKNTNGGNFDICTIEADISLAIRKVQRGF